MTEVKHSNQADRSTASQLGRFSNAGLMFGATAFLVGATSLLIGLLLVRLPFKQSTMATRIVLAVTCVCGGVLIGAMLIAIRRRIVVINWGQEGFTYQVGWWKPILGRALWSEPVQAILFIGKGRREDRRPFLFILRTGCHELRIDSIQASWGKVRPFIERLKEVHGVSEAQFNPALVDQGHSVRQITFDAEG